MTPQKELLHLQELLVNFLRAFMLSDGNKKKIYSIVMLLRIITKS